jgi:hypothetical protein
MKFLTLLAEGFRQSPINLRIQMLLAACSIPVSLAGLTARAFELTTPAVMLCILADGMIFLSLMFGLREQQAMYKRNGERLVRMEQEFREIMRRNKARFNDVLREHGLPPMED